MHTIWYILALVRILPLNAILIIIYLKHELQSTKHLVSLDAYNRFILSVSFIPPCSSIEHSWQPIDHDYPAFITAFEQF